MGGGIKNFEKIEFFDPKSDRAISTPLLIKDRFFAFLTILRIAVNGHIPEIWEISPKFWVFDRFHPFWQNPVFGVFDPPRTPLRGHSGEGELGCLWVAPPIPRKPPKTLLLGGGSWGNFGIEEIKTPTEDDLM